MVLNQFFANKSKQKWLFKHPQYWVGPCFDCHYTSNGLQLQIVFPGLHLWNVIAKKQGVPSQENIPNSIDIFALTKDICVLNKRLAIKFDILALSYQCHLLYDSRKI